MFVELKSLYRRSGSSLSPSIIQLVNLFPLGFSIRLQYHPVIQICLLVGFLAGLAGVRRAWTVYFAMRNTPTSRIATSAQGRVETCGVASIYERMQYSPVSMTPCCWYSFQILERNAKGQWVAQEFGQSESDFCIADASGECIVHIDGAIFSTQPKRVWEEAGLKYIEHRIDVGDTVYVLGRFESVNYLPAPSVMRQATAIIDSARANGAANGETDREAKIKWLQAIDTATQRLGIPRFSPTPALLKAKNNEYPLLISNRHEHDIHSEYFWFGFRHATVAVLFFSLFIYFYA